MTWGVHVVFYMDNWPADDLRRVAGYENGIFINGFPTKVEATDYARQVVGGMGHKWEVYDEVGLNDFKEKIDRAKEDFLNYVPGDERFEAAREFLASLPPVEQAQAWADILTHDQLPE
jgi:hypothetical protein